MITSGRYEILKWINNEEPVIWTRLYARFKGGWEALETWNLIKEVSEPGDTRLCYIVTEAGRAALAEYESQSASNVRDDLARDLHDPATQDGPGATSKAAKLALVEGMIASKQHITDTVAALQARITQLEAENAALQARVYDEQFAGDQEHTERRKLEAHISELESEVQRQSDGWAAEVHLRHEAEADTADAREVSRIKGVELDAAIAENAAYRAAIEPIADAVKHDFDLMKARDDHNLYILNSDGDEHLFIETEQDELRVKHLRHAAEVYAKFDPTMPYEESPDGAQLPGREGDSE